MNKCPGCLKQLKAAKPQFCAKCGALLFDSRNVAPVLAFSLTDIPRQPEQAAVETIKRISISGVQFKVPLLLNDKQLEINGNRGPLEFILKPPPRSFDIKHPEAVPANEHLTMQIARQVFGLRTAANACLYFADAQTAAYLTRRFDVTPAGRLAQEDFAQADNRSRATNGTNFKYETSHEHIAALIRRFVTAVPPALDEFFRLTLFNYLISNGDAHLKNFSVFRLPNGEYQLTPAYDLLNTALHVNDGNGLALELFADEYVTPSFEANGFLAYDDFLELGRRLGLPLSRVKKLLADIVQHEDKIQALIDRSFLPPELQTRYAAVLAERRQRLRYSAAPPS
ncbi:type II toxin-antitoxin system HipA family toxin [Hymenobacter aquaticus]|uniref:Type II toxin-antitoxin system HipA family toxin n=1 Tax=Hymenobacter aquaticus TaxID=1867101 RepID=A0A4Z0PTR6_9BACT|nr:HipA domain-containing protein [Hymenobacter aquaticus]TGE20401.1 type II toxin-antitoxin system HipA family toxin [Hymenobacter aquaticus]